jgi:hypothetical protein
MINKLEVIQNMLMVIRPFIDGYSRPPVDKENHQLTSIEMHMNLVVVLAGVTSSVVAAHFLKVNENIIASIVSVEREIKSLIERIKEQDHDQSTVEALEVGFAQINSMLDTTIVMISAARCRL